MIITDDYNLSSPILEAYSYYSFGLQQKGIGLSENNNLVNKLRFFGKEIQEREFNEGIGLAPVTDSGVCPSHKWLTTHYNDLNRTDTTWIYSTTSAFSSLLARAAASGKYPTAAPTAPTFLTETH